MLLAEQERRRERNNNKFSAQFTNASHMGTQHRTMQMTADLRQELMEQTALFLVQKGRIGVYNAYNQLIGYKDSDHDGVPDEELDPTGSYKTIQEFMFDGELVVTIYKTVDGYVTYNHRRRKLSASTCNYGIVKMMANKILHKHKAISNRRK